MGNLLIVDKKYLISNSGKTFSLFLEFRQHLRLSLAFATAYGPLFTLNLWESAWSGLPCRFEILGIDDQAAAHSFALAFGMKVGFVPQRQVDDAALAR